VWWTGGVALVLALGGWWIARRDPYRLPWRYRKAQLARRVAAVLTLVGASVAVLVLWRA
jgi:hypothetical protein